MKYFLTGGAGFIGSHITEKLLSDTHTKQVYIYDNFSSSTQNNLNFIDDSRLIVIEADLRDKHRLYSELDEDVDMVFHLAANPDISKAESNPSLDFDQGTKLTNNLLEVFSDSKPENVLITSSSCVYKDEGPNTISERYLFEQNPF